MVDLEDIKQVTQPMVTNKTTQMVAFFNKITGEFIGTVIGNNSEDINKDYYDTKIIQINPKIEEYVGDFKSGSVKNILDVKPQILETHMNENTGEKILSEAAYHKQINAISDVINEMLIGNVSEKTKDKFFNVRKIIKNNIAENNRLKEEYRKSPEHDFLSKKDLSKIAKNQIAGAVGEIIKDAEAKGEYE